jgi:hypothetical protein
VQGVQPLKNPKFKYQKAKFSDTCNFQKMCYILIRADKGKPAERRGRKATGLSCQSSLTSEEGKRDNMVAGLPKRGNLGGFPRMLYRPFILPRNLGFFILWR